MAFDGVPVAPGRRPGQRGPGPECQGIIGGGPHQAGKGIEREPRRGGHPLDLPDESDQVVGGNRGSRMVLGASVVLDGDRPAPQGIHQAARHGVTGHGEGDPRHQPFGPHRRVGQRHQRMERAPPRVGSEHVQSERPGQMDHDGALHGSHLRSDPGHLIVGRGDHQEVDAGSAADQRATAAERPAALEPTDRVERRHQRPAGTAGSDYSECGHETPFDVPAPCGCRSRQRIQVLPVTVYPRGQPHHQRPPASPRRPGREPARPVAPRRTSAGASGGGAR